MPEAAARKEWKSLIPFYATKSGVSISYVVHVSNATTRTESGHILEVCSEHLKCSNLSGEEIRVIDLRQGRSTEGAGVAFEVHVDSEVEAILLNAMLNATTLDERLLKATFYRCLRNFTLSKTLSSTKLVEPRMTKKSAVIHENIRTMMRECGTGETALSTIYAFPRWNELPPFLLEIPSPEMRTLQDISALMAASRETAEQREPDPHCPLRRLKSPDPAPPRRTPRSPAPAHDEEVRKFRKR